MLGLEEVEGFAHEDQQVAHRRDVLQGLGEALQLLTVGQQGGDVLGAAQAGSDDRVQLGRRGVGLGQVVVDVVFLQDVFFRSQTRLTSAQNDAQRARAVSTNVVTQLETGGVLLHHHVDQGDMEIRLLFQDFDGLGPDCRRW